jgi:hypothetical protein
MLSSVQTMEEALSSIILIIVGVIIGACGTCWSLWFSVLMMGFASDSNPPAWKVYGAGAVFGLPCLLLFGVGPFVAAYFLWK